MAKPEDSVINRIRIQSSCCNREKLGRSDKMGEKKNREEEPSERLPPRSAWCTWPGPAGRPAPTGCSASP